MNKQGSPLKQAWDEFDAIRERIKDPSLGAREHFELVTRSNVLSRQIYAMTPRAKSQHARRYG